MKQKARLKALVLSAVLILSTVVSVTHPLIAYAASYTDMKIQDKTKLYEEYMALSECFGGAALSSESINNHYITGSDAVAFKWFRSMGLNAGFLVSPNDGVATCDGAWVKDIVNTLGWTSGADALKAFGFQPAGDNNGDFDPPGNAKQRFQQAANAFFGGSAPTLTDEMKYTMYYTTFFGGCGANDLGPAKGAKTDPLTIANSNQGVHATIVNKTTGLPEEHLFSINDRSKRVAVDVTPAGKNADNTCEEVAGSMSKYAAAYSTYITNPRSPDKLSDTLTPEATSNQGTKASQCVIDGIGWIVCPVMGFMAQIVDKAYDVVSAMLTVNAFTATNNKLMYAAWINMRNLANIAFIIAFLVVIYSQITGAGISNYGLKRMLPRIIIAAILVNISFWLCALAVDLSNIIGASMRGLIEGVGGKNLGSVSITNSAGATGSGWVGIVGGILSATLIGTAALYVGLAALLPALISALLVILTVLLVLTLRQALVILLVVVSPLAFVAYLLPNTNEWFSKWRKLFFALLLMYPVVGVLFGASSLASTIVQNGAAGGTGAGDEGIKVAVQIMGALLQILPLVLLPTLMKTASGVLGKFAGMVNNPTKGPFDRMRKGAQGFRERQEGRRAIRSFNGGRTMGLGKYQRQAKRQAIDSGIKQSLSHAQNQYVAKEALSDPSIANKIAGGTAFNQASASDITRAIQNAQFVIDKVEAEEVQAARVTFDRSGMGSQTAMAMLEGKDANGAPLAKPLTQSERIALRNKVVEAGDAGDIEKLWDSSSSIEQKERNALASAITQNKPVGIGMGAIAQMRENNPAKPVGSFRQVLAEGAADGRYDPANAAKADSSELKILREILTSTNTTTIDNAATAKGKTKAEIVAQIKSDATVARDDPRFNAGKSRGELNELAKI